MNSVLSISIKHVQDEFETGALDLAPQGQNGLQTSTFFEKNYHLLFQAVGGAVGGRGRRHLLFANTKKGPISYYYYYNSSFA